MSGIGLLSIGAFVPERKLTNQDLEKMVETTDEWIFQRTGIRERHIAGEGVHPSDMAAEAARNCLDGRDVRPDLLISSSATVERHCPYQASIVANRLKFENLAAFDINAACSGLVYGMAIASSMMRSGGFKYGLLTASEKMSAFTDYTDRASCILFGDGAAATVLSLSGDDGPGLLAWDFGCDGSATGVLGIPAGGSRLPSTPENLASGGHYVKMQGREVFRRAVRAVVDSGMLALERAGVASSDVKWFLPHQANVRIIDAAAQRLGIPRERTIVNIERFGNTSAASIPLALAEAADDGRFADGDLILLSGFGAGMGWASALVRWGRP